MNASADGAPVVTGAVEIEADHSIDRIIDSQDNGASGLTLNRKCDGLIQTPYCNEHDGNTEFILSKPSSEMAALTLDPQVGDSP